jgi:uncharacterized membrane protein YphA (DoxX/SURF4 family)
MAAESPTMLESLQQTKGPWSLFGRIGFRFCFVYFILLSLANGTINSIFLIPKVDVPDWATLWPIRLGIFWVARHIFRIKAELVYTDSSGSGDKTFDWVLAFSVLVIATLVTAGWSMADRKPRNYPTLSKWFHLFLRIALASQMFVYGFAKVVPLQMYFPFLFKFLEPLRNFSPMGVLWTSIGMSPAYESFTGCAEVVGGLLLISSRTTTLGALICLADMIQVFTLNMTYDVCVKLFAFHLVLISLLVLAPNLPQLFSLFVRNQPAKLDPPGPLFSTPRANRIANFVLAILWCWMIAANLVDVWDGWRAVGSARPKSALYGIWTIDQLAVDGQPQSLTVTNTDQWRRITFDLPNWVHIQSMDDTLTGYGAVLDTQKHTLALTTASDRSWRGDFTYARPATDELSLDGTVNGHKEHIQLRLMDDARFPVTSRGFHWVQDYPFNH